MQKMSPLFPQDRSTPSTSLVTATVTVQSSRNSVDESDDGGSDRSSVMSLVVPEGSVVNPVSTEHGRLRSNSRLSQWSQRSGSAVPKGNNLGPLQSSSSLPLPTLSHTRSVTGATTTATAGTVPTETEQTRLGMGNTLKPGPPVQRRLSEDVGDPNDIPDTDLLATGAVEAVEAALSSIVRNTPARATGCGVRFEEPRGDRADSTTTYWGPGDTLTDSSAKEQTNPESCESDSASSARSKPQEHAESSTSWWSYPTLMWQNNDSSTNSIEDNNPDEAPASDDKSSTLLTTFLRSPMQYFGGKGDTRGITDSESIPEDGSTKPGTEVSFSGPTRDGGALAATLTTPALASTDGESDREDSVIDETLLQNSVYQAPPGDLLLSNKIAKIAQELDRKRQQHAIVLALIDKAKTLDKWNELRILQKSQSALNREIQLLSFQRQQYERQAKENVIVPKVTRITIPSCNRSFTHDMTTEVAAVELGERRGTATKRSTQQVTPMEEWSHVRSSVEGAEVPEGIRSRNTIAGSSSMVRRNPHYSRLNPNPLRSSLFLDSVDLTANVSDYPVDSVNVTSPPSRITTNRKVNDAALPTHANSSSGLSLTTPSTVTTMSAETAPGTVQTPTTAFTLYLIEIQQMSADGSYDSGWVVARRYREFSALHQQLKRRFSVVRQYDFPRKHQLPTLSKLWPLNPARREFPWPPHVENRRLALEKYLQSITQHQEVCQSLELRWFLSQQQRELSALSEILGRESASDETVKSGLGLLGIVAPTEAVGTGTKGELPSGESASSSASLNEMDGNTSTLSISTMRTVGMSKDANRPSRRGVSGHHRVATASSTSTAAGHPGTLSNTQLTRKGLRGEQRHQRSSSFLNPVQKTIADGLEDIVGSPVVLDMISEQLSRQVTGLTPTSHLVYRQKGEEPLGKHHRYPTTTTGMVTSVATNVTSMADPLCDLMIEVFELKSKNNWLRRQAISMLLRTLLGNTIDWWFRETVQDLVAIPQLTQYLRTLHDNLWPGNRPFTPPTPRTDVEKFTTWEEAGAKWRFYMPTVAGSLVGRRNARRGANRIFHLMQNPHLNENLLYFILDELVLTLFPELLP
ncbi:tRNA (guanine-N(7)-)-methyltransferase (tRNA(m7G46)-methyltransferase) [Dispira parvispora]|uniref:tRNA (Guanine-N(7)-)-methyltransferase (tRNA(m7G46)-methyltransferase) n=1 Tax=Dispira parvispora TaxID=1520584 RepID=A0A9W8AP16_9FUNG|nr:tRNA (guanine-N(7)-)-methyltransferase (tRNA(m7G46)-methyltransferase) [Dispira parvispora]